MSAPTPPRSLAVLAFAATIGVGAFLLFQVQFILGKQILPWFGGVPAVWTTCMLFFQVLLLAGYGYAHLLSSRLSPRRQRNVHLLMLGVALLILLLRVTMWPSPINPADGWKPTADDVPSVAILVLLVVTIGVPFLVLSATGPLLQAWYARCFPGASPYRLYALSNLGSLLGLLSYPFVLEPLWSVTAQGWGWSAGFVVFAVGCGGTAMLVGRTSTAEASAEAEAEAGADAEAEADDAPPTTAAKGLWLVLAMIASILLLAITSQISLEVAVIPFLWMLPLALYLLSFVLTFEYEWAYRRTLWIPLLLIGSGCTAVIVHMGVDAPMLLQLTVYLLTLLFACMVCHGELVRRKPAARYLTSFYLLVSAGGAAGGVFTGIVAPAAFPDLWELPLALVGACALAIALGLSRPSKRWRKIARVATGLCAVYVLALAIAFVEHSRDQLDDNLYVTRGFFGVMRVDQDIDDNEDVRTRLRHGRIIHGLQYEDPALAHEPSTYYGPGSGVGLAITTHPRRAQGQPLRLGFVGLGAGTLAAYAFDGDQVRFYEINPDVVALSSGRDPYFTYLRDCRGTVTVAVGDARIELERESDQGLDVLALDAFSSDAIPAHLLTTEAIALYLRHLRDDDSIIAVHISNRYLDLDPVVRGLAEAHGLSVVRIDDMTDSDQVYSSDWMLLSRSPAALDRALTMATPTDPPTPGPEGWPLWTDSYSNLVQVLKD